MRAVIAIDSFKGSLTSIEAGEAAKEGIQRVFPNAEIRVVPVADGGEGSVDAFTANGTASKERIKVKGPLGDIIEAEYAILSDKATAIIEMSAASGITLVPPALRNPMKTTTYGVGEIIANAIKKGCRRFIIGIGGSATNDGGIGMLQALGFNIMDEKGAEVAFGAEGLSRIHSVNDKDSIKELDECSFYIACDVTNPLCGENGCSKIFAPQKGADAEMIAQMDKWLLKYAEVVKKLYPNSDKDFPGAGAAGGLGFAFLSFLNGKLQNGIDLVLNEIGIESYIKEADIVITGEGKLDGQTAMGKAPTGIAKLAKKHDKPVIAFSGCVSDEAVICNQHGIDAYFPVLRNVCTLEDAMDSKNAYKNMADTAEQVFRLIKSIK